MGKLEGKVAIVTGASRGIGKEVAELFASEGAKVVCSARTLHEGAHPLGGALETTVAEIKDRGGEAVPIVCDVSDPDDCSRLIEETKQAYGPIDVLVNNAAMNYFIPVVDYLPHRWVRAFAVNIHGPFFLSHFVLPGMIERRSGAIVNISSGGAIGPGRGPYETSGRGIRGGTMYGASKAALERFTQGLAEEVWQYRISVSCFSPSQVVPTPATVYHGLVKDLDAIEGESREIMAKAALLLATEPYEKVSGRVTYSQQILQEFGWITDGRGTGIDHPGTGYSQI